ncbi:glycogen/starch/alpha-glucan phosphorylase [Catenovulum sp. SM1970]|uniref:glycogen/starch/alpha-glucan phosphorylase n=1 Tax=Marinifaba aquimaris TaxID=2741323 RepID=UPI0015727688|nr:glycogen/starch/alpha-glucan phosphorylase [Marinifaba aquimaris]NTS76022.1 glycogen/starch/alpha-glucan phosphorylase [Marinifaba aquimaris]
MATVKSTKTTGKKAAPAKSSKAKAESAPAKAPSQSKPAHIIDVPKTVEELKVSILRHLHTTQGTDSEKASKKAWWGATASAINEVVFERVTQTQKKQRKTDTRAVHYLSLEYLMGRLLKNNLCSLDLMGVAEQALTELGCDFHEIYDEEPDMALGNGGLGRLAACYIDSLATLNYPAIGYGIHYEHGLFNQSFLGGRQVERPDSWREYGNPWEICRPESVQEIPLYGYVETRYNEQGEIEKEWHPGRIIKGVPWDIPIVGYGESNVNILRLWESRASDFFNWDVFNAGGYLDSHVENVQAETISKVLYPNDTTDAGKELRLIQQYFFTACSIKDIVRRYKRAHGDDWSKFADQVVMQLNDTHPAVAIPEMMRILIDRAGMEWDDAWALCQKVFAYTNHTLLPEALEKWPVHLFERVLPRHLEIIYEINARFLDGIVSKVFADDEHLDAIKSKLSIIEEGDHKMVRMGNLSVIGSFKVNGVAQIHSELVKSDLFPEFYRIWPEKFTNVTNGVTPRRWLKACNPKLSELIDKHIDADWPVHLDKLQGLAKKAKNKTFQNAFMKIKHDNKVELAKTIKELTDVDVDPNAIFDIQIKRLHEYKRQQLNLIHIMALYRRLLQNPDLDVPKRVFIFGAKAAPGYHMAKEIIYAINKVADRINLDERIKDKLKVVLLPNYRVSLAEKMIPAADVSEQISTAGKEASGTGNMKLALNGAVTVGTLDGANIEIAEEVGDDNIVIFGLTVAQVKELKGEGYNPWDYYYANPELKAVLDWFDTDYFTPGKPGELADVKRSMLDYGDEYLCLADYQSYSQAHKRVDELFRDKAKWAEMAIINTAKMGKFNSDRSIEDYVRDIWKLESCQAV